MTNEASLKRARFRDLHREGCFVIPNAWDLGGVRRLEKLGFPAIASTGAGFAWSLGRSDQQLTLEEALDHLRALCSATELPVNGDFESGYADDPEAIYVNVLRAIDTGLAGLSIEDRKGAELLDPDIAAERIRAARCAIRDSGHDVMLIGRSEGHFIGRPDLIETIDRLLAYSEAGADCLFAPGIIELAEVASVVEAVRPKPVNVMITASSPSVEELASVGVRRVSIGASLAAASWRGFDRAAKMLFEIGRLPPRQ